MAVIDTKCLARLFLADCADAALAQQHPVIVPGRQPILELEPALGVILSLLLPGFRVGLALLPPQLVFPRAVFATALFLLFSIFLVFRITRPLGREYSFPILRIFGISALFSFVVQ